MAIDTDAKRRSALMLFGPSVFPAGAIGKPGRAASLWHYTGIEVAEPVEEPGTTTITPRKEDERLVRVPLV